MAIHPPEDRIWWNEKLTMPEILWISVAFVWGLIMFSAMIYWHAVGEQNLSNEAYKISPDVLPNAQRPWPKNIRCARKAIPGYRWCIPRRALTFICSGGCGSGGRFWSWRRGSNTGCISLPWIGSTAFRCNRKHQSANSSWLRDGDHGHTGQNRRAFGRLQRILRHRTSHHGWQDLRRGQEEIEKK